VHPLAVESHRHFHHSVFNFFWGCSLHHSKQVSATHRLEDNKEEVARCKAAGCEIAPSTVEGKPAGPIRCVPSCCVAAALFIASLHLNGKVGGTV